MILTRNVIRIGDSLGVTLPAEFVKPKGVSRITDKDTLGCIQGNSCIIYLIKYIDEARLKKILDLIEQ